ncbi:hypothetical protein SAMN05421810_10760 [Amycolatopsis arida]|uniref:Glyoxalase-like domain-containing protein n=1 Tax=Amycolatopsis arida TaxID=587909 RepID=A0A1I5YC22_9PSEU|nr:VOC family protein [Amycolatopsis arida]TDX90416.1 hypothetical protein CLV69_10760 [Amycolatopsis arida]SFQ41764.1 hypothetical protein SAMN05421810_10760 [Amycolatopsis arida]
MSAPTVPTFGSVVLDCPDAPALARFYGELLGWSTPEGGDGWWTLTNPAGGPAIEFQQVTGYQPPEWPSQHRPQQFHLDLKVTDLPAAHERAVRLGATVLDRSHDAFWVYADPAGHPFCLCAC